MSTQSSGALVESVSIALLIGLSGFLYLYTSYFKRFQLAASAQHTRTSLAFAYGLAIMIASSCAGFFIKEHFTGLNSLLTTNWGNISPFGSLRGEFFAAPILGLVLGLLSNFYLLICNSDLPFLKEKNHPLYSNDLRGRMRIAALSKLAITTEDQMLATLWRALTLGKLIQVTLKTRKVYIGSPLASKDPSIESRWLKIVPIASGFRHDETLSYVPTTDYRSLFDLLVGNNDLSSKVDTKEVALAGTDILFDPNDVGILIPWIEITSLTIYDPALEALFEKSNPTQTE